MKLDIRPYTPVAGSLADRVLTLVARNADDEYTSNDLALKFDVSASGIAQKLEPALINGLLLHGRTDPDSRAKVWRAGPRLQPWATQREAGAVARLGGTTPMPTPAPWPVGKPQRATRGSIDPGAVQVHKAMPIPGRYTGVSPYPALWARLQVGDCADLPDRSAHGLTAYCKAQGHAFAMRRLRPGHKGVWRKA